MEPANIEMLFQWLYMLYSKRETIQLNLNQSPDPLKAERINQRFKPWEGLHLPLLAWRWGRPHEKKLPGGLRKLRVTSDWQPARNQAPQSYKHKDFPQSKGTWKQILPQDFQRKAQLGLNFGLGKPSSENQVEPTWASDLKNSELLKEYFNTILSCYVCGHF